MDKAYKQRTNNESDFKKAFKIFFMKGGELYELQLDSTGQLPE
ncbi:MAG TPA: hypothetical protein VGE40_13640 [Bacilli bacterium]